ncbi:MAG: enoyl-CoA hydratase/isomerase family protein [Sphingomonadales bacterium]|nr:enoyl-CoA hydratase/isomerase family protein [Sphingomonadales bacterium]
MSGARITREDAGGLCILTLNRPEKLNALDTASFEELDSHCAALEGAGASIGCVLVAAQGRAFCAGADIGKLGAGAIDPRFKPGVIERLANLPQPVIAAVHGTCFTGGLELALAADIIIADTTARFADTHGKWGLVGAWGLSQRLPRRIGIGAARLMMFTAQTVAAEEARALGLVDRLVEGGTLGEASRALAGAILANSWHSNFATKRLLRETDGLPLAQGLAQENYRNPGFAPDYQDRIARFGKSRGPMTAAERGLPREVG